MATGKEITSFNQELVSFNVDDLSVEELERRLELTVATIVPVASGSCTSFSGKCSGFTGHCNGF